MRPSLLASFAAASFILVATILSGCNNTQRTNNDHDGDVGQHTDAEQNQEADADLDAEMDDSDTSGDAELSDSGDVGGEPLDVEEFCLNVCTTMDMCIPGENTEECTANCATSTLDYQTTGEECGDNYLEYMECISTLDCSGMAAAIRLEEIQSGDPCYEEATGFALKCLYAEQWEDYCADNCVIKLACDAINSEEMAQCMTDCVDELDSLYMVTNKCPFSHMELHECAWTQGCAGAEAALTEINGDNECLYSITERFLACSPDGPQLQESIDSYCSLMFFCSETTSQEDCEKELTALSYAISQENQHCLPLIKDFLDCQVGYDCATLEAENNSTLCPDEIQTMIDNTCLI